MVPVVRRYGHSALLVEVPDADTARRVAAWVGRSGVDCLDVVPAARTVLLDGVADLEQAARVVEQFASLPASLTAVPDASAATVTLPVRYDGEDLAKVGAHWGVDVDEVVRRHTSVDFTSAFCGFAPGFAYLEGLPEEWALPRLASPRPRVPAGAVALADRWSAVYPTSSPGGWMLLGVTEVAVWDLARQNAPALLAPGTRVRFEAL